MTRWEYTSRPWSVDPDTLADLRLKAAWDALESGELHQALVEAEELLDQTPGHVAALAVVGHAALALGDALTASDAYNAALAERGDDPELIEGLAFARFEAVDFEAAAQVVDRLLLLDDGRPQAWALSAQLHARQGDRRAARAAWRRAHDLAPDLFPLPRPVPRGTWKFALDEARSMLPGPLRAFYARVPVKWGTWPPPDLLKSTSPPMSPRNDALYVGVPPAEGEGDPWTELPEAVWLFRGNLSYPPANASELAHRISKALFEEAAAWLNLADEEEP